jgi:aldehyde dehydrogenase (NAD+)
MAVWAWNSMLALVCGDSVIWKPSENGALCAQALQSVLDEAKSRAQGGTLVEGGGRVTDTVPAGRFYVRPAIVTVAGNLGIVCEETFAPILYVMGYRHFEEAIHLQNGVRQGLSSAIFTNDARESEWFISQSGSDAWKAYMRRATNTINYGRDVPLAQGVQFAI